MYEEITKMTDLELKELEKLIAVERDKRAKREAAEALNEMTTLIQKWNQRGISFYMCTDEGSITLEASEICVERK
jgi:hypothetical protein